MSDKLLSEALGFDDEGVDVHLDHEGNPRWVERTLKVEEAHAGMRLDHFVKQKIPRLSRTKIQEIIRTQIRRGDGQAMKAHATVQSGQEYIIRRPAQPEPPCPRTFEVLHDDGPLVVIDKPAGLPMHTSAKFYFNTLARVLVERYPDDDMQICHRIDRETSGILVVARGKDAAAKVKQGFANKRVEKSYLAIVHGQPPWPNERSGEFFEIDLPLGLTEDPDALITLRMVVRDNARPARTRVQVISRHEVYALVRCIPITGRQHQIRAHLAAAGFPIVGDKLYAHDDESFAAYCDEGLNAELLARFQLPRQALHAASIALDHPVTGKRIRVDCPLPPDLCEFLQISSPPL